MKIKSLVSIFIFLISIATAFAENITLSGSDSYTAQDGDVLTGSTSGTVTIAADAKITLSDVTITGGIVCSGTAEITLVGTNSVSGATNMAGIQVGGSGTTLTIKGNGSLTANGANNSAGIGLSRAWKVDATGGDIVIEGGNITATGKGMGAGIGTGVSFGDDANHTATIGNIIIKGGTVTAIGGTNQYFPGSGIGKGGAYSHGNTVVGTVTITTNIDLVKASSISQSVTYKHGETDVTSIASDYFTINEDGNRRVIVPKDDTDYTVTIDEEITGGTVTADKTTAKAGELVTLTITPASGHVLQSLAVKDASDYDVPVSNKEFIMPKGSVTVSATFIRTTAAFDQATGVLTLNGNVVADEVKAYGAIIGDYGAIVKESPVTSVVCEPGTVLPADCSELFLNYTNSITIDLSNADISGVTNMSKMFGSQSLTTIYVNSAWSMENVTSSDQMFYGCNLLRGGNGSRWEDVRVAVWESNGKDLEAAKAKASRSSYAIIDGKGGLPGYLTVKPKQTPSAPTANVITYTGEAQELVSAGDGTMLYSLDDGIYSAEIPTATAAGTYTVHYKVDGSDNWNAVIAQTVEVTIAPKALSITAKNKTIAYGDEPANDGVEYSGFVATDNEDSLNGALVYSFDYKQYDEVGKYTITPSGLTSDNYDITFVDGELTVEQKKLTVTAKNDTITYGDEPPNASVEYSGFVGSDDASVLGGTLAFNTDYKQYGNVGTYAITPSGLTADNYDISFASGTLTVEPKKTDFAAVQILEDENGARAIIDGEYTADNAAVNIPENIEVASVEFTRSFTPDVFATVTFPFEVNTSCLTGIDSIIEFQGITADYEVDFGVIWKKTENGEQTHITLQPYHPYMISMNSATLGINCQDQEHTSLTLKATSEEAAEDIVQRYGNWIFTGTLAYKQWQAGDPDLTPTRVVYGYAAEADEKYGVGAFVRIGTDASISPFRAYIKYSPLPRSSAPYNKPVPEGVTTAKLTRSVYSVDAGIDDLPESMDVAIVSKDENGNEHTTVIGSINTRTGEIRFNRRTADRWFDMQGRVLQGKPTVKGRYLHNGKVEIVK